MYSLSIIIINFNTFKLTCQCISSVIETNKSIDDLEIIVIDNGSNEKTKFEFVDLFPSVKYYRNEKNMGFAHANNIGLKLATKENILLLNSDALIKINDTLFRCLEKLYSFDTPVVLSPSLMSEDGSCQVSYGPLPSFAREILMSLFIYKIIPANLRKKLLYVFVGEEERAIRKGWLAATCLFFKKEQLKELPDEKLYDQTFLYGEELFWGYFWNKIGVVQYYYNQENIVHLVGQSSKINKNYSVKKRKAYQMYGEYIFLKFRYSKIVMFMYYLIRLFRISILSIFDKKIILIRSMTADILLSKFTKKYPFVINNIP
jgi:GT2 family glycosyltransferase